MRTLRPFPLLLLLPLFSFGQFADWKHTGTITILTTAEGVALPATASVTNFPLLVRLHADWFPFDQAAADGSDLRVSAKGQGLAFEIERWDPGAGAADIWVRVPLIRGDERQPIQLHWGKANAEPVSDGKAVFARDNGMIAVWHMNGEVRETTGTLRSEDKGTRDAPGRIGGARHFPKAGVFCGEDIEVLPQGGDAHSSQMWFRPEAPNGRMLGWGKEFRQGKITMFYKAPPGIRMDCYFSNADVRTPIPGAGRNLPGWTHVVHTYENNQARLYINGEERGRGNPRAAALNLERPARLWIGGWYNNYDYQGDIDELRISNVARSAAWVKLEYENQKPNQTLLGHLIQNGSAFAVAPERVSIKEGGRVELTAKAGGAEKVRWILVRDGNETVLATDRFRLPFDAGRVTDDAAFSIRFEAVHADGLRSIKVPVSVTEALPEPVFALRAPSTWNGRDRIEIVPKIKNLKALRDANVDEFELTWNLSGLATLHHEKDAILVLERAQNSGPLTVSLTIANGGAPVSASTTIEVREPESDPWVARVPDPEEKPVDGQFYARDDSGDRGDRGKGTMHVRGNVENADQVILKVFADPIGNDSLRNDTPAPLFSEQTRKPGPDGSYAFTVQLEPNLVAYRVELASKSGQKESIIHRAKDIFCGDAILIHGQSNALATDTREESPRETHPWVRSYGHPRFFKEGERENLWCKPVWKAHGTEHMAELGWWGMEMAKQLVERHEVPVFVLNAARGGTRIDQHQRDHADPTNLDTIYGTMLWRLRRAKLTHGLRTAIWHQGENDQGAAGPDGGHGWENYQRYFIQMTADWKRDLPNLRHQYLFQIWPSACAMGRDGNGDLLRERQRTLPRLFSNTSILSTYDIRPPGGCHFPLEGWAVLADRVMPLIERDLHGRTVDRNLNAANLERAAFGEGKTSIILTFDQAVVWQDEVAQQFFLDGEKDWVTGGQVSGNVLTLTLKAASAASRITYLKESSWNKEHLLLGANGMGALTFCDVPLE